MEIRDGFIVGIYNYCDAWCARCAFTSYCRVFADLREAEAAGLPAEDDERRESRESGVASEREAIDRRADGYSRRVRAWLKDLDIDTSSEVGDPRAVVAWFHMMIHVKAMRALEGLAEDDPSERDYPPDHDGSAKVALIGIDRSHTAWLDLVEVGLVPASDAAPFVEDLVWLRGALERSFPKARSFVRPAFDEPAEVARLLKSRNY